jgi:pentatricopeptide repeat protein
MYAKCGMLAKAEQVLEQLPIRDLVSWNTLISGYGQQGETQKAFICFQKLKDEGLDPDTITFICLLQACRTSGAIDKGKQIHDEIISRALDKEVMLVTALIDMYAKCGVLTRAQELLEELPVRDLISWSAMIGGYVHQGESPEALRCYKELEYEGLCPDSVLLISVLKACGKMGGMEKTAHIYDEVLRIGSLEKDVMLSNSLMDMYVKCGELAKAQNILEELPIRDVVSWNVIIHGYAQQGRSHEALNCFSQMQREGVLPDAATYVSILTTSSETFDADNGKDIHHQILKRGLLMRNDGVLCNSLVGMYTKCAPLATAREVFDGLPSIRCIEVWNTLIIGHAHRGQSHEALQYFEQMRSEGQLPNSITLTCVLKACGIAGSTGKAKCIHSEVVNRGFLGSNLVLGNALVDMYAKCGMFVKANQVLQELPIRNVVSWSGLISGYLQQEQGHAALNCFGLMRSDGLCADEVTLACIAKACGYSGALARGELIHKEIVRNGWFGRDIVVGNALVDMYAKCGQLEKAKEVMEEDGHLTNIISWNALISGYGRRRQGHEALGCFQCMQCKGFLPDKVTMLSLLSACGHCGLLAEAQALYENMARAYGVVPDMEHHACMVSCLGRYGHFDEASSLVLKKAAAVCVDPTAWLVLLGACREWGNSMLGRLCFDRIHE